MIISQAPGSKVHETGIPWNDASGDRLRDWTDLNRSKFRPGKSRSFPLVFVIPARPRTAVISRLVRNALPLARART